jgi:hypothetical protein
MANLKGASFEKQLKNANIRLNALNTSKNGDHLTHSRATMEKRDMYGRDFAEHMKEQGYDFGKLNSYMNNDNIKEFLEQRTDELSKVTAESYIRGFSSYIEGLQEVGIDIEATKEPYEDLMTNIREMPDIEEEICKSIESPEAILEGLPYDSSVVLELQLENGFRASESLEICTNLDKYLSDDGYLEGVQGKGGRIYEPKPLSEELIKKIEDINKVPSYTTYENHLKKYDITSHQARYTYVKDSYEKGIEQGKEHKELLSEISREINHSRADITQYYLNRA